MTDKTCARFYQPRRRRVREPQQVLHAGLGYRGYDLFLDRESGHQVHGIRVDVAAFLEPNEETTQASSLRVHIAAGGSATLTARPLAEPQGARCKIDEILFQVPRRYLVNWGPGMLVGVGGQAREASFEGVGIGPPWPAAVMEMIKPRAASRRPTPVTRQNSVSNLCVAAR